MVNTSHFYTLLGFEEKFDVEYGSTDQGLPYDFSSIMHYYHNTFSLPYKSTLMPRIYTFYKNDLGSSATATDTDFLHINLLYCGGKIMCAEKNYA